MNQLRTKGKIGMGKDKHKTIETIGVSIEASCHEVVLNSRPDLGAEHVTNSNFDHSDFTPMSRDS